MTIIEFFDDSAIKNIAAWLACAPQKVIFLGNDLAQMRKALPFYRAVLKRHGSKTKLFAQMIPQGSLAQTVRHLSRIVAENEACVFELSGGDELYALAVGVLLERFPHKVKCCRFDPVTGHATDVLHGKTAVAALPFALSTDDLITLHGGRIIRDPHADFYTYPWRFTPAFSAMLEKLWLICKASPAHWNVQIGMLGVLARQSDENALSVQCDLQTARKLCRERGFRADFAPNFFNALYEVGALTQFCLDKTFGVTFSDPQIKKCLTVAGQVLELILAQRIRALQKEDGALSDEVRVGVVIDWDGDCESCALQTVNEIDVLAVCGMTPLFLSCKNGFTDADELYKLNTVAEKFGGTYVKKAIAIADMDKLGKRADLLRARAEEMDICLLPDVAALSDEQLNALLRTLFEPRADTDGT